MIAAKRQRSGMTDGLQPSMACNPVPALILSRLAQKNQDCSGTARYSSEFVNCQIAGTKRLHSAIDPLDAVQTT